MGVPKTVISDLEEFVGARPEPMLLDAVQRAAEAAQSPSGLIV